MVIRTGEEGKVGRSWGQGDEDVLRRVTERLKEIVCKVGSLRYIAGTVLKGGSDERTKGSLFRAGATRVGEC